MKYRFKVKTKEGETIWYDFDGGKSGLIVPVIENGTTYDKLPYDIRMIIIKKMLEERAGIC